MPTSAATAPTDVNLYVEIVGLPAECRPCYVVRKHGRTLLMTDPSATRDEAARWCLAHLTHAEQSVLWTSYGQAEHFLNDQRTVFLDVPPVLRVPSSAVRAAQVLSA